MTEKSVVFICAHPDDLTVAAGTMFLLKRKGYRLYDFCLTRGQRGKSPGEGLDTGDVRTKEEEAACALIGAELTMFDQMDGELYAHREICEDVAERLKKIEPAAVITLWPLEKPDHSAAFSVAHHALRLSDLYFTTELYMADADGGAYRFQPDLYVNISNVIDDKKALIRCYPSQMSEGAVNAIAGRNRREGHLSWCEYAEGFKTAVPLMGTRWNRPAEVGRVLLDL